MSNNINTNTIIFTLARMNPPTPGHLYLIQRLIEEGIKKGVDSVYIILSKTNDNNENPISCAEKVKILGNNDNMIEVIKMKMIELEHNADMKEKINNINVMSICVPNIKSATPFTVISNLIYQRIEQHIDNINLFIIIGDDRAEMLDSIADAYFFKMNEINSVNGLVLERTNMNSYKSLSKKELEKINIDTIPIDAFSASFIRKIVKFGLKSQFDKIYSNYLTQEIINELYDLISSGLELPDDKKKPGKIKPIKYEYPLVKSNKIELDTALPLSKLPPSNLPPSKRKRTGGKSYNFNKSRKNRKTRKNKK
jgi:nicotinic acid mononucleotide adenylyltransferase